MSTCIYTGDLTETCPISLANVRELEYPVVLLGDHNTQPFECKMLMEWLLRTHQHPITRQIVNIEDIIPLVRSDNDNMIVRTTRIMINNFTEEYQYTKVVVKPIFCT